MQWLCSPNHQAELEICEIEWPGTIHTLQASHLWQDEGLEVGEGS